MKYDNINSIIAEYGNVALRMLSLSFPLLSQTEIATAIDYSVRKRMKNGSLYVKNNYKNVRIDSTVLEMANYILDRQPIITSAGVMFAKHADSVNPLYKLIDEFINTRVKYKKQMFKYPKGSELFQKYNLLQLLAKLDANALYGVIGAYSSVFYNIYLAESTTTQGQSCTKAAILAFESFLANNVAFRSLNEIVVFIDNVCNEVTERKYKDCDILDENIKLEEAFFKIMSTCNFDYIPSQTEMTIVWNMMMQLSQEDINRLYYKNNLYSFMDNSSMTKAMEIMLCGLDKPFMDPNEAPEEIEVELNTFWDILSEYVYYHYQYIDRMDRVQYMIRKVAIIADTDSSIISLDAWYRYNLDKVYNIPMTIKRHLYKPLFELKYDEFGDCINMINPIEEIDPVYDYNFYTDEVIETERLINPITICPQEGLRYSIINIIAYCLSKMILDYMKRYTVNSNSYDERRGNSVALMRMKNEFLFKRVLTKQDAKKNYANIQEIQEGKIIPKEKGLTIMGMPMTKATLADRTQQRLKEILYEDILNTGEVDQIKVLKDLALFEKEIYRHIMSGGRDYFKPATVKSIDNYEDPMRIVGIKGTIVYNNLRDENMQALDLDTRNSVDLIKLNINMENVDGLKELHPDKYAKCIELMNNVKQFKDKIDIMALPLNENPPEWIKPYIDFNSIINFNLGTFPLESIGLSKMDKKQVNYSNIISL